MKKFEGFPAKMNFTAVPNLFFSQLLPQITDMAELKLTLHVMATLYARRGHPRYVSGAELAAESALMTSLGNDEEALKTALAAALKRGTLIHLAMKKGSQKHNIYMLNTPSDRTTLEKIHNGEIELNGLAATSETALPEKQTDIFTLYEENIGLLTPMVAEELKEAEKLYPDAWIREAFKEAVSLNKRSLRYIIRILENWQREGKDDGTHRRDSKKGQDKYAGQKYDHMFRR